MIDKTKLTKRYYTITEVSKLFDVSNSLLRYWETEFGIIKPVKGRNNIRRYTVQEIEKIETIYHLLKTRGFTIDGAKKELKKKPTKELDKGEVKSKLLDLKKRLEALRKGF